MAVHVYSSQVASLFLLLLNHLQCCCCFLLHLLLHPLLLLQVLSRKLDSPVAVPVYSSHAAALTGGSAAGECFLSAGDRAMLWLGPVPEDKLPKDAQGGRSLFLYGLILNWLGCLSGDYVEGELVSRGVALLLYDIHWKLQRQCMQHVPGTQYSGRAMLGLGPVPGDNLPKDAQGQQMLLLFGFNLDLLHHCNFPLKLWASLMDIHSREAGSGCGVVEWDPLVCTSAADCFPLDGVQQACPQGSVKRGMVPAVASCQWGCTVPGTMSAIHAHAHGTHIWCIVRQFSLVAARWQAAQAWTG